MPKSSTIIAAAIGSDGLGRAYQKMASGVENPAEWFELQDILELGGKAIERTLF